MSHIEHHLAPPGMTLGNVFLTDMSLLPAGREIRDRHIDRAQPPASTAVQVAALFRPGYLVEIDALAVVRETADDPETDPI